ncbi:glycosyltransferase family 1 protein [Curtobacterium sp. HSID17257]|nr:glycosyltransferase family 1 protein [Curtobacterium sp. HSID17257]
MRVLFPGRIVDRHVGGNTTYARMLVGGVESAGHAAACLPWARHPVVTAALETFAGLRRSEDTVIHYSADTGPLFPTTVPSVVTVHGVASRWITAARNPLQEQVWRSRVGAAIRSTGRLVTVSRSAADDISEVFQVDPSTISVIPHGIDHDAFAVPTMLSERLAHLASRPFVLYLGNIEPRKNVRSLIEAFERPALRRSGVRLVLAGRPAWGYRETFERLSTAVNCEYVGFVDDAERAALMQHTELFAFPSLYEGFGFPVLEALAAGVPVVASRRGSLAEVAGPSRTLGDLSAEGLERDVLAALSDERWKESLRRSGPAWASRFTWEQSIAAHLRIYEEVLR